MEIIEAIKKRKSIRKFRPALLSRETLTKVLHAACQAPSALNTQPWEFIAVAMNTRRVCF